MEIKVLKPTFSVCKVADECAVDLFSPFCFVGKTDEEISVVCPTEYVPKKTIAREDGWRAMRIQGSLEFSMIGVLSRIATILAAGQISIFAVSTFNTDYIMLKKELLPKAIQLLSCNGYTFI